MSLRPWHLVGLVAVGLGVGYSASQLASHHPPHQPSIADSLLMARHPAPDFTLQAAGAPIHLGSFKGKVVLLNFWESSCPHCRHEVSQLVGLRRKLEPRGFEVIGVLLDEDDARVIKALSTALNLNYPIGIGTEAIARQYGGVLVTPTSFLIDRKGTIAQVFLGSVSQASLEKAVRPLL